MSPGSFKQDGLGWRINLIRRRFGEWLEYQTSKLDPDIDLNVESGDFSLLKQALKLLWQVVKFSLWLIIAILAAWMIWQLWLLLRTYWKRWQRPESDRYTAFTPPSPTINLSAKDWVERSQSARIDGNYRQAIFCLYQAMLKLLDERGLIPTQLSLTDGEYQRSLLAINISPMTAYELLLSIHQRLCFSSAEANQTLFEECQQAYQQIEVTSNQS